MGGRIQWSAAKDAAAVEVDDGQEEMLPSTCGDFGQKSDQSTMKKKLPLVNDKIIILIIPSKH